MDTTDCHCACGLSQLIIKHSVHVPSLHVTSIGREGERGWSYREERRELGRRGWS